VLRLRCVAFMGYERKGFLLFSERWVYEIMIDLMGRKWNRLYLNMIIHEFTL
jgi:hypothetical protein